MFELQDGCLAVSMLAFYFYLAAFFWMLVEGVYIYLMVTKVFRGNVSRERRLAYLLGWGEYSHFTIATGGLAIREVRGPNPGTSRRFVRHFVDESLYRYVKGIHRTFEKLIECFPIHMRLLQ